METNRYEQQVSEVLDYQQFEPEIKNDLFSNKNDCKVFLDVDLDLHEGNQAGEYRGKSLKLGMNHS